MAQDAEPPVGNARLDFGDRRMEAARISDCEHDPRPRRRVERALSARIKTALATAKARGVKLGSRDGGRALLAAGKGNVAALAARQASAVTWRRRVVPIIAAIRATGVTSHRSIARELEQRGILTLRGGRWRDATVRKLIASEF
jgi:hypothetical protein